MFSVDIPLAVQLVIDDVGWREGWSLADQGGPYRAGVNRLLEPDDYLAIAELGKRLSMRPQAAMVLCEWDKTNVCALCPTSTHVGKSWDNTSRVGSWTDITADIFRRRAAHLELTMHGVGHEHWENGVRTRAEWYAYKENIRWPWPVLQQHLATFRAILDQHGLGPANGHSLPVSAVPCAFSYYFDAADPHSTGALFSSAGVKFVSTPFSGACRRNSALAAADGGFEHGLIVIDRGATGIPWYVYDTVPAAPTVGPICGIHWPNLLTPDPDQNEQSISHWVDYLSKINEASDYMLAANTRECFAQWLYKRFVTLRWENNELIVDGRNIPAEGEALAASAPMWLKLPHMAFDCISVTNGGARVVARGQCAQFDMVALAGIAGGEHRLALNSAATPTVMAIRGADSCHVADLHHTEAMTEVTVEVYGSRQLHVAAALPPKYCVSASTDLQVGPWYYDTAAKECHVNVQAGDIQGRIGNIRLYY